MGSVVAPVWWATGRPGGTQERDLYKGPSSQAQFRRLARKDPLIGRGRRGSIRLRQFGDGRASLPQVGSNCFVAAHFGDVGQPI